MASKVISSLTDQKSFERMCAGKEQYTSESAASAAIKILAKERILTHASNLIAYKCDFGEHWHFGH